jgi:hypothetical protein
LIISLLLFCVSKKVTKKRQKIRFENRTAGICFGASALRRFGASALRRFGASALRRFGASTLRQAQRPKLSDRSSADTTDFRAYALENSEELRTKSACPPLAGKIIQWLIEIIPSGI